jgi:transposase
MLVVMEATGNYWVALATVLHEAGYVVAVLNPAHIHSYARSLPRRAKTDALDAELLVQFAAERQPPPWQPPPAVYHELRQRLVARDGLIAVRTHVRNQRHALVQWPVVVESVKDQLDSVIRDLTKRIDKLEQEIEAILNESAWSESAALLLSIPGVGIVTTGWLLVATLNFELCETPKAAAAFVGLAPMMRESGSSVRGRPQNGHAGHSRLRTALYMATLQAARRNPVIKDCYERLRAAGKPMKVARCAAARKLLHLTWAVVTKRKAFDPCHQAQTRNRLEALVSG